ncbi:hypothetical protein STEG23_004649 [Scotinomys teguina]
MESYEEDSEAFQNWNMDNAQLLVLTMLPFSLMYLKPDGQGSPRRNDFPTTQSERVNIQAETSIVKGLVCSGWLFQLSLEVPPSLMFPMTVTPLGRDQDCSLKIRELYVPVPWFLDPGGWSETATVSLYFVFPGICTLSLDSTYLASQQRQKNETIFT